jgi:uncharacterized protein (TIGR02391 family)
MLDWYISVMKSCRTLRQKANDALETFEGNPDVDVSQIKKYMSEDIDRLTASWPEGEKTGRMGDLARHVHFGMEGDFRDILNNDIPSIENVADDIAGSDASVMAEVGFEKLLHPAIVSASMHQYHSGHFRDAILNSVTVIFDMIRDRTDLDLDGAALATHVFSVKNPLLIFSEIKTKSGQNDQVGFMKILEGIYTGVRNPKAHSLNHNLTPEITGQYLVFASLLARRVDEASNPN